MNESRRARPSPTGDWDRARRAYLALVAEADPAAAALIAGLEAVDLRPGGPQRPDHDPARALIVSGPDDLIELRGIVEVAVGVGTWPDPPTVQGQRHTGQLVVERPAAAIGLLLAMEGLIVERSPWRKWRTAVETMAPAIAELSALTVDAVLLQKPGRAMRAGSSERV